MGTPTIGFDTPKDRTPNEETQIGDRRRKLARILIVPAISLVAFCSVKILNSLDAVNHLNESTWELELDVRQTKRAAENFTTIDDIWRASTDRFINFLDKQQMIETGEVGLVDLHQRRRDVGRDLARLEKFTLTDYPLLVRPASFLEILLCIEDSTWTDCMTIVANLKAGETTFENNSPVQGLRDRAFAYDRANTAFIEILKSFPDDTQQSIREYEDRILELRRKQTQIYLWSVFFGGLIGAGLVAILYLILESLGIRLGRRESSLILPPHS